MGKISNFFRIRYLRIKAKLVRFSQSQIFVFLMTIDITFIFLWFSVLFLGLDWTWRTLLASFGLWYLLREIFKHLRLIAAETKQNR